MGSINAHCGLLSLLTRFGTRFGDFRGLGQQTVFKYVRRGTYLPLFGGSQRVPGIKFMGGTTYLDVGGKSTA